MYRFTGVMYKSGSQTAGNGAGLVWDDVYATIEPHGVSVDGGRTTGMVWLPVVSLWEEVCLNIHHGKQINTVNIDTVTPFKLAKPDGKVVTVTMASAEPNLFFRSQGSGNLNGSL
jgi:hypothetical protein